MRVARVEPTRDGAAGFLEHDALRANVPLAGERRDVAAARRAEIRLGRSQVVPVGLRLHSHPFHGHEFALDAEEFLDHALRLLVAPLAEMLVADDAVRVDEVERRPVIVGEGAPDRVVVVGRDRIVDRSLLRGPPHAVDVVLERELWGMDADHDQAVVPVGLRPRAYVRLLAQPVDARERPEVHEDDVAAQLGGTEWLRIEPPGRAIQRWHADTRKHRHLAKLPERRTDLAGEQLRLLPGGEVAAPVDLVEVAEAGIGRLDPAARGSPELAGERREADGDLDVRGSVAGGSGLVA